MGEEMDEAVAKGVFGWPQAALDCLDIPIPPYSTCDRAVGAVLEKFKYDDRFNALLRAYLDEVASHMSSRFPDEEWDWRKKPALISFYVGPKVFCEIALKVIGLQGDRLEKSQRVATCHPHSEISEVQGVPVQLEGRSI